jgi:hypothetical protein
MINSEILLAAKITRGGINILTLDKNFFYSRVCAFIQEVFSSLFASSNESADRVNQERSLTKRVSVLGRLIQHALINLLKMKGLIA